MSSVLLRVLFATAVACVLAFVALQGDFTTNNEDEDDGIAEHENNKNNNAAKICLCDSKINSPREPSSSSSALRKINWTNILALDDAAGQVWQFSGQSSTSFSPVRSSIKTFQEIVDEYKTCKGQRNMSGEPDPELVRIAAQSTPMWKASDDDIEKICKKRGTTRIKDPNKIPFIVYGGLFGFEVDIVEIMLHETVPVVDAVVLVESTMTHAKHEKPLVFRDLLTSRLKRFAHFVPPPNDDVVHLQYDLNNSLDEINKHYKIFPKAYVARKFIQWRVSSRRIAQRNVAPRSGWEVEKRQRHEFHLAIGPVLKYLIAASPDPEVAQSRPVIVVSQLDLDEIPSRETLLYWKHCVNPSLPLRVFWFRYHLECQQQKEHARFTTTVWSLPSASTPVPLSGPNLDFLYLKRKKVIPVSNSDGDLAKSLCETAMLGKGDAAAAWHFSAFGGLLAVRRKNKHSPHAFVREEIVSEEELRNCIFNHEKRFPLPPEWWQCNSKDAKMRTFVRMEDRTKVMPVALPHFVSENICMFTKMGWMS